MAKSVLLGVALIGSTSVDLQIVNKKSGKVLEKVHHSISLDNDIYVAGYAADEQINYLIKMLLRFQQLLADYNVEHFHVWGAYSLASAQNAMYISARIQQATGLKVEWLSASQEAYYGQASMRYGDQNFPKADEKVFLMSMSSGRLSLGYYIAGKLQFTRNINLGPIRLASQLEELEDEVVDLEGLVREFINSKLADYNYLLPIFDAADLLLVSGSLTLERTLTMPIVDTADFLKSNQRILNDPRQKWVNEYHFTAVQTDTIMMELLLMESFVKATKARQIGISQQHILPGIVLDETGQLTGDEVLVHAFELSRRFQVEPKHQAAVLHFSEQLFDRMKAVHGLDKRSRLLLQVAALVHDVGSYLNSYHHYENSETIILADEIDGLTPLEMRMVALIAHYHSYETPGAALENVTGLTESAQIKVIKLAALLRLADALDDSRLQKISKITVSMKNEEIELTGYSHEKLYLEQWTFEEKANLFEKIFGRQIILKRKAV
ncbi:HD domain-containing protein [Weissella muntiaci]|uniref:HD domain-containing protein n=1 Tax=Weissella muntiaci TaxID=2508881 RepID=A0A6C2C5U7_9LACO|nr:HD domain-containing protein [Weissella muntiaci]TYC48923.1 HD domain-containing protein [Weissella muntiaci]